jgi:hypothetical protein
MGFYGLKHQVKVQGPRALLEKLIVVLLAKKFSVCYGTGRLITVFIRTCNWKLS